MELEEEEEEEPKPKSYIMCTFIRLVHGYGLFFSFNGFSTNKQHCMYPFLKQVQGPHRTSLSYYPNLIDHCLSLKSLGQNGPLPLIIEIFCPETLFGKYIAIYHFLWYSSLVSSSTPFFCSSVAPDMASGI